ncbi:MAG: alpha/beta hydrolase, partial [Alphaproteobacteria bacterium]
MNDTNKEGGRLSQVVGHWLARIQVAGISHGDALRVIADAGEWENWCAAWCAEGERHAGMAQDAKSQGRLVTAGEAYGRAALFFHFGQFMFFDDLDQKWAAAARKVEVFAQAAPLLDPPAEAIVVPFDGGELRGYLRRPGHGPADGSAPLAILIPGSDSTKEEFPSLEAHFLRRGLATFSFDGPGQGEGRRLAPLTPDWGPVLEAVLARLEGAQGLNGRFGVMGMAFGGHLALQAAAGLADIEAVVCMNGFYDLGAFWDQLPEVYRANMGFTLGGDNPDETGKRARGFSLQGLAPPPCPVLAIHGGLDRIFPLSDAEKIAGLGGDDGEFVAYADGNHVCNNIAYKYRPLIADWM